MRKLLICLLTLLMVFAASGCSDKPDDNSNIKPGTNDGTNTNELEGVTLEVAVNYTGESLTVFQQICSAFEGKTGATIVIDNYGQDYASTMVTRMAANNLPDVFVTAGWSLRRYKEYSIDLSDQDYCKQYSDSALGVIQDDDGAIYVCMLSIGINGNVVNLSVCQEAGVDPYAIHTWEDFLDACEKIKQAGFTPIASNPDAGLTCNIAGTFLTYENAIADVGDKLLDGTWDWKEYIHVLKFYQKALENEYFFKDARSINTNDMYERFASGKAAFIISENTASIQTSYNLNPKGNFIFAPFPASTDEGEEAVTAGEGDAFGIWKDSKNIEAAKMFLNYLSTPEVTLKFLNATSRMACQKNVMEIDDTPGTMAFKKMQEDYSDHNIGYYNIWDRDYLPSGMWGYMDTAASKMFADYSDDGLQNIVEFLRKAFVNLYNNPIIE
jgi:raffinose/stachyose/melibiose transport system substrate-binding protein